MRPRIPTIMAALVVFTAVAFAQPQSAPPSAASTNPASSNISAADRTFAPKAAAAGLAEVNDAQIALQNASRQDVKDFAQRMVQDHTKANNRLKLIASSKGIMLPITETARDQKKTDALQKLSGAKFDRRYVKGQRAAHKQAVKLFSGQSKDGKDDQLNPLRARRCRRFRITSR